MADHVAAAFAAERGCHGRPWPWPVECRDDVGALARGRNRDHQVAGAAERGDLTGKNLIEAEIVAGTR